MRVRVLSREEASAAARDLDAEQRAYLSAVAEALRPGLDGGEVQDLLYSTALERGLKPKRAFAALYTVLLGKKSGPRAGPFVARLPVEVVRERLSV
jgi:lysyl-tRNA synthetase class 1